ncbi:NmrA family NAD(P)-binding protein [Streptomyces sp. DSM 44915]|uniref:NmrA family NAD(P)-binding protein n=1 Tax=Streptomyces chisholmiae TaxID=3075540 RepID=A0ABU2JQL7_9ACTN|nr:NmrA family NAD(P)-binding protein [Streptomyces sp. DSM 44915]MDT0267281.1 NmrA family NAD(P)-binding protein [Streptomyces sp. DSM 44915]
MTTIAVTGATGRLGGRIIEQLLDAGVAAADIAPLVRTHDKGAPWRERGMDVRVGSYDDPIALTAALAGVDKVVLVPPPSLDNAVRVHQQHQAVRALHALGVSHLVYVSLADPERRPFDLEDVDLATEHIIRAVGLPFTFMRNSVYMDELGPELRVAAKTGALVSATGNRPLNWVCLDDLATATATVLAGRGHQGLTYQLTNTELFTYDDLADLLAEATGRTINHRPASPQQAVQALAEGGMDAHHAEMMVGSFHAAIAKDTFDTTSADVRKLTGRAPAVSVERVRRLLG